MLRLALAFLIIALIAGFFGYAGVANLSWDGAQISSSSSSFSQFSPSWQGVSEPEL